MLGIGRTNRFESRSGFLSSFILCDDCWLLFCAAFGPSVSPGYGHNVAVMWRVQITHTLNSRHWMGFLGVDRDIPIREAEQYRRPDPPPLRLEGRRWDRDRALSPRRKETEIMIRAMSLHLLAPFGLCSALTFNTPLYNLSLFFTLFPCLKPTGCLAISHLRNRACPQLSNTKMMTYLTNFMLIIKSRITCTSPDVLFCLREFVLTPGLLIRDRSFCRAGLGRRFPFNAVHKYEFRPTGIKSWMLEEITVML